MGTDIGTWTDDTLDGLMDHLRENSEYVAPGFGVAYRHTGRWFWTMSHGPRWFNKQMHPQRNPGGLGIGAVFCNATRAEDLRGLHAINDRGITPLGWLFVATGWTARSRTETPHMAPRDHENARHVFMSTFLDQLTGKLTIHMNYYPDELKVITQDMPEGGWQAGDPHQLVSTMDLFRLACLTPQHPTTGPR